MTWAATQAKAKFSEMLDKAESSGPQVVTRRKREFVVMTREEHDRLEAVKSAKAPKPFVSAWEALGGNSGEKFDFEIPRLPMRIRPVDFLVICRTSFGSGGALSQLFTLSQGFANPLT